MTNFIWNTTGRRGGLIGAAQYRTNGQGLAVTAFCHHAPCNHSQPLDLAKLRDRFGPDAPAMEWDFRPKLKCSKCGGKAIGLIYTPDTSSNAYGKAKDADRS